MILSKNLETLKQITSDHPSYFIDFDAEGWLGDDANVMIVSDQDVALFEHTRLSIYTGHYFFKSRGRDALVKGRNILDFLFKNFEVSGVRGLTPVDNKPARWMSKQLGFQSLGFIDTLNGSCELFFKSKGA